MFVEVIANLHRRSLLQVRERARTQFGFDLPDVDFILLDVTIDGFAMIEVIG